MSFKREVASRLLPLVGALDALWTTMSGRLVWIKFGFKFHDIAAEKSKGQAKITLHRIIYKRYLPLINVLRDRICFEFSLSFTFRPTFIGPAAVKRREASII